MESEFKQTPDGRFICPKCLRPMNSISQGNYDIVEWEQDAEKYQKIDCPGDSQEPVCGECGEYIGWAYADLLSLVEENKNGIEKDKTGRIVCPVCRTPMDEIQQTMYDYITWGWDKKNKMYCKATDGDADKPKCGHCDSILSWEIGEELGY